MNATGKTLDVRGARLHYDVRGAGPPLLLIPGGWGDAAQFTRMIPLLTSTYAVVSYDPRGLSRSTLDDADADITVDVQADDAHRLLAAITREPAYVLGISSGALTGLALAGRHPDQVHTLIAHEPPVPRLLPGGEQVRAWVDEVCRAFHHDGPFAAMQAFLTGAGLGDEDNPRDPAPPDPEMLAVFGQTLDQMTRNLSLFFAHMFSPIADYRPDAAALRVASSRVVMAAGTASAGQLAHQGAVVLADLLDTSLVEFPGDHGAFMNNPEAFAEALHRVLTGRD